MPGRIMLPLISLAFAAGLNIGATPRSFAPFRLTTNRVWVIFRFALPGGSGTGC